MSSIILSIHVIIAVLLIGLILVQHGKGADAGAAFGSGASSTVFGSQGSASFLTRLTAGLAVGFFVTTLILAYSTKTSQSGHEDVDIPTPVEKILEKDSPVAPAPDTADKPVAPVSSSDDIPAQVVDSAKEKPAATTTDKPAAPTGGAISE